MNWRALFQELTWRNIAKELMIALSIAVFFSILFTLGHLAVHQELPRWK